MLAFWLRLSPQVQEAKEAYACLVAVPVFKTGVGEDLVQVGSIPIRLRPFDEYGLRVHPVPVGIRLGGSA